MRKKVKKRETKNIYITAMKSSTKYKMKLIFVIAFITASIIYI